jgi:biopolymer transport protein ExbB
MTLTLNQRRTAAVLAVALLALAPALRVQAVPEDPAAAAAAYGIPPGEGMSVAQIMRAGGVLMWVLAALSVVGLAFVVYLFAVLRTEAIAPSGIRRPLAEALQQGSLDEVRRICGMHPCPLSAIARAAADHVQSVPAADPALLKDVMQGEGSRQAEDIQGQTQYLLDVAVISPMVGLLGTVFGMLHAFSSVAHDIASAKPVVLAEGVAMALLTTAFGLIVGIPAMMFYAYFRRRAAKQICHLEAAATDLLTAILGKGGDRRHIVEIKDQLRQA